ncbi:MAG: response regulator transcription factor [Deltaproteobacteria bacterium]|nr:response regulator transcription factor [Deltaproteobacteria bacterium]
MENVVAVAGPDSPLVQALRLAGWRVRLRDPAQPLDELAALSPDALVVDVPDPELAATVEALRSGPGLEATPILAAIGAELLREASLLRQLTDFVVRPASAAELGARLRRVVRRTTPGAATHLLAAGALTIDLKRFEATLAGQVIDLAYQEFQLLRFLVAHPNQAFSRDQLLARVWGWDYFGGSRTVDIHVRRVRQKLGHPLAGWLQTVRHVGYRWVPDAQPGSGDGDDGGERSELGQGD